MADLSSMRCCAVGEVDGLGEHRSGAQALKGILRDTFTQETWDFDDHRGKRIDRPHISNAFLIFTETNRGKYGERLQKLIEKEGLGEVMVTGWKKNPNSRNQVRVFTWTLNAPRCKEWWEAHK